MNHKELLQKIWAAVYDPHSDPRTVIQTYFHPDYEQCINGVTLQRDAYIDHVIEQRKNIVVDSIDYKHILEDGDELFALYYPKCRDLAGQPVSVEVIAYFKFIDNQLINIHGNVRMIEGNPSDIDMRDQV